MTEPTELSAIDAVTGRHSMRRFLPEPVSEETIRAILAAAARTPSGTNSQPWKVHVVTGAARERVSAAVLEAAKAGERSEEYPYMPSPLPEPYKSRRREVGFALYELYGIARDDMAGRTAAMLRNFEFFGAPMGLFFSMDRALEYGSWLDCGMFMQNVMIVARAHGLETCPQQAWCEFGATVHRALDLPDDQVLISGMAMGVADMTAPENSLVSKRVLVDEFASFLN